MRTFDQLVEEGRTALRMIESAHREQAAILLNAAAEMTPDDFLGLVWDVFGKGNEMHLRLVKLPALAWFVRGGGDDELQRAEEADLKAAKLFDFKLKHAAAWCEWAARNWTPEVTA